MNFVMTVILFSQLVVAAISSSTAAATPSDNSCNQPGRLAPLCYKMKSLRSHLLILEGQRELMQVNYPLLGAFGRSMEQIVGKIMVSRYYDEHLHKVTAVRSMAQELAQQAAEHSPLAITTANEIRSACQGCHTPTSAENPLSWEQIIKSDWQQIDNHCNEAGRNPYVCKHMNAMVIGFEYFSAVGPAGDFDYETAGFNARELVRVATQLQNLGGEIHPNGNEALGQVIKKAQELADLADQEDPRLFQREATLTTACQGCHSQP